MFKLLMAAGLILILLALATLFYVHRDLTGTVPHMFGFLLAMVWISMWINWQIATGQVVPFTFEWGMLILLLAALVPPAPSVIRAIRKIRA